MNVKDFFRLLLITEHTSHQVGKAAAVSHNTDNLCREPLAESGLSWQEATLLSEAEFNALLNRVRRALKSRFVGPDSAHLHAELLCTGVTFSLIYEEYVEVAPGGRILEAEFRLQYARYERAQGIVIHQLRLPGYQHFLDSNKHPTSMNREPAEAFRVAVARGKVRGRTFAINGRRGRFEMTAELAPYLDEQQKRSSDARFTRLEKPPLRN